MRKNNLANQFEVRKITSEGYEILTECNSRQVAYLYYDQFKKQGGAEDRIVIYDKSLRCEVKSC